MNIARQIVKKTTAAPAKAAAPKTTMLDVSKIRIDGGTQSRAGLDQPTVQHYAEDLAEGATFPPVVVFHDGAVYWLADGFHRHAAHVQAGIKKIAAELRQGTARDAILHSVGANAVHGLRRSRADTWRAVETLLRDPEWSAWSNREIARRCNVSDKTVASIRADVTAEFRSERTYTTKHGTVATMDTSAIGKRDPEPETAHEDTSDDFYEAIKDSYPKLSQPSPEAAPAAADPVDTQPSTEKPAEPAPPPTGPSYDEMRAALLLLAGLSVDDFARLCPPNKRASMCQIMTGLAETFDRVKEGVSA